MTIKALKMITNENVSVQKILQKLRTKLQKSCAKHNQIITAKYCKKFAKIIIGGKPTRVAKCQIFYTDKNLS